MLGILLCVIIFFGFIINLSVTMDKYFEQQKEKEINLKK